MLNKKSTFVMLAVLFSNASILFSQGEEVSVKEAKRIAAVNQLIQEQVLTDVVEETVETVEEVIETVTE